MPFFIEALLAVFRIVLWFILLFGVIGPLFLGYARSQKGIEKLIFGWVGLSGVIIVAVFSLTVLHLYDFISLVLTLLLIPLVRSLMKSRKSLFQYFSDFEIQALIRQIRFLEHLNGFRVKIKTSIKKPGINLGYPFLALSIALAGGIIRLTPGLSNAAPFNRSWYFELNRVKNIQLQDYFSGNPEPAGMHALVSVFSMLTQVPPELILHLTGALVSFFLCFIIYWAIGDITGEEVPAARLLGMSVYALTPGLLMPFSADAQILAGTIYLALCFAIPTILIFARYLKTGDKRPWFYICSGFVATGMTNLFVAYVILLPVTIIILLCSRFGRDLRSLIKLFGRLAALSTIALLPVLLYYLLYGLNVHRFFAEQMLDAGAFSYYPQLVMPIELLSTLFFGLAGILAVGYALKYIIGNTREVRDEGIFLLIFAAVAFICTPFAGTPVDVNQLSPFYSILIAIFIGVVFATILRWANMLLGLSRRWFQFSGVVCCFFILCSALYLQGGIQFSRQLPATIPDGFQNAYYRIISNHLPYSYATVTPEIGHIAAKNRHYFMNYRFFLNEYADIDSLYRHQLVLPPAERKINSIPPASIFVFVEKPPYGAIQQGILYDSPAVMKNVAQWLAAYGQKEGRKVRTYYEDEKAIVYQIINRKNETEIGDILSRIHPHQIDDKHTNE